MDNKLNYYKILQIDPEAEPEIVEAAYKRLARKYHPDVNPASDAKERMQAINLAYETLGDPRRRAEYDRQQSRRTKRGRGRSSRRSATPNQRRADPPPSTRPTLEVRPDTLEFGPLAKGSTSSARLQVGVSQGRLVSGRIRANSGWIRVRSTPVTEAMMTIEVTVDTTGLRGGVRHFGTLTINSVLGGTRTVPISVYVAPEPRPALRVEPEELDFGLMYPGQPPQTQSLRVVNAGSELLTGEIRFKAPWLDADPVEFESNDLTLPVTVDVAKLTPGRTYTTRLVVESNGGITAIPIKVRVGLAERPLPPPDSEDYWPVLIERLRPEGKWERQFVANLALQARQRGWQPSAQQEAVIERIRARGLG